MEPRIATSTISIEGGTREAWSVLADELLNKATWVSGVVSSDLNPETPDGIIGHNDTRRNQ
jgi:hypothetical protein